MGGWFGDRECGQRPSTVYCAADPTTVAAQSLAPTSQASLLVISSRQRLLCRTCTLRPGALPIDGSVAYRFIPSASHAAASIFALPWTMASLAVSPHIQRSSMSAHTCMRARLGPDRLAWL